MAEEKDKKEKEKEEKIEIPEKFKDIVEKIENLSVSELNELVKVLEKKFGVSAMPVQATAVAQAAGSQAETEQAEKSSFNIELKEVGDQKIAVIKLIRDITQKGLKESKDLVDAVEKGPQVIKENVKKEEAEEIKKKFESVGAKVDLK